MYLAYIKTTVMKYICIVDLSYHKNGIILKQTITIVMCVVAHSIPLYQSSIYTITGSGALYIGSLVWVFRPRLRRHWFCRKVSILCYRLSTTVVYTQCHVECTLHCYCVISSPMHSIGTIIITV